MTLDQLDAAFAGEDIPEGYVCFRGRLIAGRGSTSRIVVDEQFLRWLDVGSDDIACHLEPPADRSDWRGSIWVRRGARMTKCEVAYAPEIANEGWGVDEGAVDDDVAIDAPRGGRRPLAARRRPPPPF